MAKRAKKKASKPGAPEFAENQELPGVHGDGAGRVEIKAIDKAYRAYAPLVKLRCSTLDKEKGAKAVLINHLHENISDLPKDAAGNPYYITTDDKRITLETKGEKLVIVDEDSGD